LRMSMPQFGPTACNSGIDRYNPASPKVFDFAHPLTKSSGKIRLVPGQSGEGVSRH
jgi:hypothetical protein